MHSQSKQQNQTKANKSKTQSNNKSINQPSNQSKHKKYRIQPQNMTKENTTTQQKPQQNQSKNPDRHALDSVYLASSVLQVDT